MKKICIVCGKEFEGGRPDKLMCSFACKAERQRQRSRAWAEAHREEQNKSRRDWYRRNCSKNPEFWNVKAPTKTEPIIARANDPKWIKDYCNGDRLTRIAMLSCALSEYGIANLSYGYLSPLFESKKYKSYEQQVFRRKRANL